MAHELKWPTEVKALCGSVSFMGPFTCFHLKGAHRSELKARWRSKIVRLLHSRTYSPCTSHFQNGGDTSTSADPVSNSMFLKLKRGARKRSRKGTEADVH